MEIEIFLEVYVAGNNFNSSGVVDTGYICSERERPSRVLVSQLLSE